MSSSSSVKKNIANLAALACIQLSNALLPVIAFPLMLNVVGADFFSRIVTTEAIALIVVALVLYSFEVEGVSRIVGLDLHADIGKISYTFSGVLYVRLLIWLLCVIVLYLLSFFIDADIFTLLASWMLFPLSYILHAYWFYQGLERNLFPAWLTLASRLLCLGALIWLVSQPSEYRRVPVIIGGVYAISGLISLAYIRLRLKIVLVKMAPAEIREFIFSGKEMFFGNISVMLFRDSNVIILGLLSNSAAVSAYSIAEKSIKIFQAGARPLNQLFFPKVIRALSGMQGPDRAAFKAVLKYVIPQLTTLLCAALLIAVAYASFRDLLPARFNFRQEADIVSLLCVMVVAVFFGVSNGMFGMAGLNYLNGRAYFARSIFITGAFSIICCISLVLLLAEVGAALSFVFSEVLLLALILRAYFGNVCVKLGGAVRDDRIV